MKRTSLLFALYIIAMMVKAFTLSGHITTDSLRALPNTSIYVTDVRMGATTDLDGNYIINGIPAGKHTVQVSYVGYKTQIHEITIEADETCNFVMEEQMLS